MTSDPGDLRRYIATEAEAEAYSPPSHTETSNLLYLPKGFLGSWQFEVAVGRARPGGGESREERLTRGRRAGPDGRGGPLRLHGGRLPEG